MQYSLYFKVIPDLPDHSQSYLPEHIRFYSPDQLVICLRQEQNETNEALKSRAEWQIKRELLRIHVLEGICFESTYLSYEPLLSFGFTGTTSTGWFHRPLAPESARSQDRWNSEIETKLLLWEKVQKENTNPILKYAYLCMICEASSIEMDWDHNSGLEPPPIQEIKIIRNLLLHNMLPNSKVTKYLRNNIPHERNVENSQRHVKLALDRLHVVLPAVWRILFIDLGFGDSRS